jgi:hypothetical protein
MASVRVGLFPPVGQLSSGPELQAMLARAADEGVDHLCVGDHVSFFVGAGCSAFNVIPCAGDAESAIAAVGELRTLLTA